MLYLSNPVFNFASPYINPMYMHLIMHAKHTYEYVWYIKFEYLSYRALSLAYWTCIFEKWKTFEYFSLFSKWSFIQTFKTLNFYFLISNIYLIRTPSICGFILYYFDVCQEIKYCSAYNNIFPFVWLKCLWSLRWFLS